MLSTSTFVLAPDQQGVVVKNNDFDGRIAYTLRHQNILFSLVILFRNEVLATCNESDSR